MDFNKKIRAIAFYLPQFHPIPENDLWWGKGFTEWTNVGKARPLFKKHYQPHVPADLGYYDLRVHESREAQAQLAQEYGIEGFCYWHYWFGNGKQLLERPFNEVLASGKPDFPFCLAWANESWRGFFHGVKTKETLIDQLYPGREDYTAHFYKVLPAFKDKRYITVDKKPLFMIFKPLNIPDIKEFIQLWQTLAHQNGLNGIYFIGHTYNSEDIPLILQHGFDAVNIVRLFEYTKHRKLHNRVFTKIRMNLLNHPNIISYKDAMRFFIGKEEEHENIIPTIIPNWDHTPRTGRKGLVFHNSTPFFFEEHLQKVKNTLDKKDNKLVFIKSWNEWAEGNYLEPDLKWGNAYLNSIRKVLFNGLFNGKA